LEQTYKDLSRYNVIRRDLLQTQRVKFIVLGGVV